MHTSLLPIKERLNDKKLDYAKRNGRLPWRPKENKYYYDFGSGVKEERQTPQTQGSAALSPVTLPEKPKEQSRTREMNLDASEVETQEVRVFSCDDPVSASADFYRKISKGGKVEALPNGKGMQTLFEDESRVVYRVLTKTPNSPAVQIFIEIPGAIANQKIHFLGR